MVRVKVIAAGTVMALMQWLCTGNTGRSSLLPRVLQILLKLIRSSGPMSSRLRPSLAARAVRPLRWTYVSDVRGTCSPDTQSFIHTHLQMRTIEAIRTNYRALICKSPLESCIIFIHTHTHTHTHTHIYISISLYIYTLVPTND